MLYFSDVGFFDWLIPIIFFLVSLLFFSLLFSFVLFYVLCVRCVLLTTLLFRLYFSLVVCCVVSCCPVCSVICAILLFCYFCRGLTVGCAGCTRERRGSFVPRCTIIIRVNLKVGGCVVIFQVLHEHARGCGRTRNTASTLQERGENRTRNKNNKKTKENKK